MNREYYPGWSSFRADMASRNIRLLTYMNPYLVDILPRFPFFKRNLFQEAVANGYFVKNSTGQETHTPTQGIHTCTLGILLKPHLTSEPHLTHTFRRASHFPRRHILYAHPPSTCHHFLCPQASR